MSTFSNRMPTPSEFSNATPIKENEACFCGSKEFESHLGVMMDSWYFCKNCGLMFAFLQKENETKGLSEEARGSPPPEGV